MLSPDRRRTPVPPSLPSVQPPASNAQVYQHLPAHLAAQLAALPPLPPLPPVAPPASNAQEFLHLPAQLAAQLAALPPLSAPQRRYRRSVTPAVAAPVRVNFSYEDICSDHVFFHLDASTCCTSSLWHLFCSPCLCEFQLFLMSEGIYTDYIHFRHILKLQLLSLFILRWHHHFSPPFLLIPPFLLSPLLLLVLLLLLLLLLGLLLLCVSLLLLSLLLHLPLLLLLLPLPLPLPLLQMGLFLIWFLLMM